MQDSKLLFIIAFVCLMTGIFTPDTVIRRKTATKKMNPFLLNGILVFIVFASGFASFLSDMTTHTPARSDNPAAFVFFDQSTHEKVAVYRMTQTNFSNHLRLEVQNRTIVDDESIQLDILLTNYLETTFNFTPDHLHVVTESGQKITPIGVLIEGNHIASDFQIEAGESVFGRFLYLKSSECINFEIKYLPIVS